MKLKDDENVAGRPSQKTASASSGDAIERGLLDRAGRKIEVVALDRLVPQKANARTHGRKQVRKIADSVARFGFCNPILIDDDDQIIAGHGRVEAAKVLGLTTVPALRLSHLSGAEKRAYVLADNRLAELAGWDKEILAIELQGLLDLDFEIESTGFDMTTIDIILGDVDAGGAERTDGPDDEIPEPTIGPAVSRVGDLWMLGEHQLLCSDTRDEFSCEKLLDVDVAIRRWQTYTGNSATLAGTGKTFGQLEEERTPRQSPGAAVDQTAVSADRKVR